MSSPIAPSPRVWLARAGEQGYALTDCVAAGVIALRYHTVADATALPLGEIATQLDKAGTRVNLSGVAAMLYEFVHSVRLEDVIVTTHLGDRAVYFGEVTGGLPVRRPLTGRRLPSPRPVDWWGSLSRDTDLPADRLRDIDRPPTF